MVAVGAVWAKSQPDARIGIFFLGLLAVLFFIVMVYQQFRYSRKARYVESLQMLTAAFLDAQDASPEAMANSEPITSITNLIAEAFTVLTGTQCAACVKFVQPTAESSDLEFVTLCRSTHSKDRDAAHGRVRHSLQKNSALLWIFEHVGQPEMEVFFEDDLPGRPHYENTSFEVYGKPKEDRPMFLNPLRRRMTWRLPYQSVILSPIVPRLSGEKEKIVGFLAVDSRSRKAFYRRYDIQLVRSLAAALHPLVYEWLSKKYPKQENLNDKKG
ncbi:MAG: hypothetical protein K8Q91_03750 [Candidatus Vogelbacteria bacterium]|nr:hypothetical protein [Candidatus Vogelbacteria bacterium]